MDKQQQVKGSAQPASDGADVSDEQRARLVVALQQVGRGDLDSAGGKGANLGELLRAGFPVPPGFVVTTTAYSRLVARSGLDKVISRALRDQADGGASIRAAFADASIPLEVEQAILAAYRELGAGPVAVRSSATAEDLPEAAFAGQQDTYLNIIGESALLDTVRRCWASLWTERAIAYRERLGLDQQTVRLAVVIQRMVPAEVAGVLFTANPVTGARHETVIDASPGLGEAVVSGLVTPDHIVLRKGWRGWRIVERRLGQREVLIQGRSDGGIEHVEGSAVADQPALPAATLRRLAGLGAAIEQHFASPQDVEWAWAAGKLWILQARPITGLPQPLAPPALPQQLAAGLVGELLPVRPYPLEMTTWGFGYLLSTLLGRLLRLFGLKPQLGQQFIEEDGVVVRFKSGWPVRPTLGILLAPWRIWRQARRYDPACWRADPLLAEVQARVRALEGRELRSLAWQDLLAVVHEALAIPLLLGEIRLRYLPRVMLATAGLRLMLGLLKRSHHFGTLLLMGVETKTLETNRELEALAARIRASPTLASMFAEREPDELWSLLEADVAGRELLARLRVFLETYGHREAGATLLLSQATWREAPEVVLGILKGLAAVEPSARAGRPRWEAALDELLTHPLFRFRPLRSLFLRILADARWFAQLREDTRFYATLILPVLRRTLLELGRRLAHAGVLADPAEVFHLKLSELEQSDASRSAPPAAKLRALVERRKAKRAALADTPLVDPRLLQPASVERDALLRGIPGSPGVAEGPVRIIRDPADFGKLRAGEVLVAPYTNPAWTPLFQRATAVVVDSGGPGSHAAIVAREYSIPAVMATGNGTSRLQDGQLVRVDGARGVVSAVDPAGTTAG